MQKRHGFTEDIYIERDEVDKEIKKQLDEEQNIIISGKPLAGKSKAIFHQLRKNFPESTIYLAKENIYEYGSLILHNSIYYHENSNDNPRFFVFNDIDKFYTCNNFQGFIKEIISARPDKNRIIASCQKCYLQEVLSALGYKLEETFSVIEIEPLSEKLREHLRRILKKSSIDMESLILDDTIGSYFVEQKYIKSLWEKLDREKQEEPSSRIQYEFLRSYKCVELWKRRNRGVKRFIIDYAKKRLQERYREGSDVYLNDWDEAIKKLLDNGFISTRPEDPKIYMEPSYLNKIIAVGETEEALALEIIRYYPDVKSITKLIARVSNSNLAQKIYREVINAGIKNDDFLFNSVMARTNSLNEAQKILQDAEKSGIQRNITTFNILIGKQENFDDSWKTYEEMKKKGIKPNEISFFALLKKVNNFDNAWKTYKEMCTEEIKPDEFVFYTLLKKTDNFEQVRKVFIDFNSYDYQPNKKFIISSIKKIHTNENNKKNIFTRIERERAFDDFMYVHNRMMSPFGIKHNPRTLKQLLENAPDYNTAWSFFKAIEQDGKIDKISPTVFTTLIGKAKTYEEALEPFEKMLDLGIPLTVHPFNKLMEKTSTFEEAWLVYEKMSGRVKCDKLTFDLLMKRTINKKTKIQNSEQKKEVEEARSQMLSNESMEE